ncbi:MAG: hypothetical protein EPN91_08305 [Salinibacterium sp.]|nr:MAG: hypothetical protein EPN91_08305 [Salinibacterium sp.]
MAQEDILRTVTALLPPEVKLSIDDFRWSSLKAPAELGMPWVTPRKYGWTGERLMAFFGLDERRNQIRVGSTAAPAQRCGNEELLLLGVSDLTKEQARAKLSPYRTEREGWFKATEKSLKLVAAMAAKYARKELSK